VSCYPTDLKTARKQALIGGQDEHLPHGTRFSVLNVGFLCILYLL